MTQTISGNLSGPARLIILNESDMTIEHNATTSGSFEVSGLSDGNKVVIARTSAGEAFGYGAVDPETYFTGYVAPYTDNFEDNGSPLFDGDWWMTRTDTSDSWADWYDSDTTFRLATTQGFTSEEDQVQTRWFYGLKLDEDFDMWVDTSRISMGTLGAGRTLQTALFLMNGQGGKSTLGVRWRADQSQYSHTFWENGVGTTDNYNLSSSAFYNGDVRKFRLRRSGNDLITYVDRGSGWELGYTFSGYGTKWGTGSVGTPSLWVYRWGTTSYQARFNDFHIEEGTIVEPITMEQFNSWSAGHTFDVNDTINEFTLVQKGANDTVRIGSNNNFLETIITDTVGAVNLDLTEKLDPDTDFVVSFRLKNYEATNGADAHATVRIYQDSPNNGFRFGINEVDNTVRVDKLNGGSWSTTYQNPTHYNSSGGTIFTIQYLHNLGRWRFHADGVQIYEEDFNMTDSLTLRYTPNTWGDDPDFNVELNWIKIQGATV